jgi:DNA-binding response OmpR family regulator
MIKAIIFIEDDVTDIWLTVTKIKAINADLKIILALDHNNSYLQKAWLQVDNKTHDLVLLETLYPGEELIEFIRRVNSVHIKNYERPMIVLLCIEEVLVDCMDLLTEMGVSYYNKPLSLDDLIEISQI